jgi:D-threo-aldose 1-dehydrogenase
VLGWHVDTIVALFLVLQRCWRNDLSVGAVKPGGPGWLRPLGSTGLTVSALALGASPLGNTPAGAGEQAAVELITRVLASPIRVIDTANGYGAGESERRIGTAIRAVGGVPADALIVTKVDPRAGDYSGERVRESVRESKQRLGVDPLPLVYLHDPEVADFAELTQRGGAVETLVRLRDEGEVGHIGLAGGPIPLMRRYLALDVFEVLLVHNRWTLVDRSATPILAEAQDRGIAVVNAAVYGGGILADPTRFETYAYRPANPAVRSAIAEIDALCKRWRTDLRTAALQFSLRDPRFASTVVGLSRPDRLDGLLADAAAELPEAFWEEAEAALPAPEHWLEPPT